MGSYSVHYDSGKVCYCKVACLSIAAELPLFTKHCVMWAGVFRFNLKISMQFIFDIIVLHGILGHGAMVFTKIDLILYYSWTIVDIVHFKPNLV